MKGNKLIKYIYEYSILILLCWGAHAWFTWQLDTSENLSKLLTYGLFSFIAFIYKRTFNVYLDHKIIALALCGLFLVGYFGKNIGITSIPIVILQLYPLYVLISDDSQIQDHLDFLLTSISAILISGILLHLFFMLGFFVSGMPIQYGDSSTYLFFNYFIDLVPVFQERSYTRFQSVFLEPGYLGTMLAFLLYASRYNFRKWQTKVIIIGLVLSMSLAGYMTAIIGYFLYAYSQNRKIKKYLPFLIAILFIYYGAQFYNEGNNVINNLIVDRLQYDSEKVISGNNRFTDVTRTNYEYYLQRGQLLFGVDDLEENDHIGAGYMVFFLTRGIISALLFLLFYYIISLKSIDKKYALGFIIIICLTFMQASYPHSYSWLIPFFLGINYREEELYR